MEKGDDDVVNGTEKGDVTRKLYRSHVRGTGHCQIIVLSFVVVKISVFIIGRGQVVENYQGVQKVSFLYPL